MTNMAELHPHIKLLDTLPVAAQTAPELEKFHNKGTPRWEVKTEQPWHRQAMYLFATGDLSATDVAHALDREPETLQNLLKQEWFQKGVTKLMAEAGGKDVMALFKAEAFSSLVTLVELRDSGKTPAPVRRAAAVDILDRAYGKPKQFVETTKGVSSEDPVAEARRLEEEATRLQRS
jgi:hypothetical protein